MKKMLSYVILALLACSVFLVINNLPELTVIFQNWFEINYDNLEPPIPNQ